MEVDLDNEAKQLPPWDFTAKIGGVRYAVRQPSVEDRESIRELHRWKADKAVEFMYSLFAEPRPPKSIITTDILVVMATNLVAYDEQRRMPFFWATAGHVLKKAKADARLTAAVTTAMQMRPN